jgi:hypothetical protein
VQEIRGISLVFREMWDAAALTLNRCSLGKTKGHGPAAPPKVIRNAFGPATTFHENVSLSFCHPERTRISYLTGLTGDHLCGSP